MSQIATTNHPITDPSTISIHETLVRHVNDHVRCSRTLPTDIQMTHMASSAVESVRRQLTAFFLVNGRVPTLQISSDVTIEELEFRSADTEYTGYLAGPGPALACQSRLRAMGISDAAIRPTIIRSEGAESSQLLLGGVCAKIINPSLDRMESRQLASLMRCTGTRPALDLPPLINKDALDLNSRDWDQGISWIGAGRLSLRKSE
jgi:hypothetical protein